MSFANNITRLCEIAARDYLRSAGLTVVQSSSIVAGFDDDSAGELPTPRIVCTCNQSEAEGPADDGVWACRLEVRAISNADDVTEEDHHTFAGEVFSQFMIGRFATAAAITAALSNFDCQDVWPLAQSKAIEERRWISTFEVKLVCAGKTLW